MADTGVFNARTSLASPTGSATLPCLQLTLNANRTYTIVRLEVTQETSTTSGALAIEVLTSSAVAPGTLVAGNALIAAANYTDTIQATVQGSGFAGALTGTQVTLLRAGFNTLSGYLYLPTPNEQFRVQGNGTNSKYLWLRLPVTVPAATYNISFVLQEV